MTTLVGQRRTTAALGVGGATALDFSFGRPAGRCYSIRIKVTAGDCTDIDWSLLSSTSGDPTTAMLAVLASGNAAIAGGLEVDEALTEPEYSTDDGSGTLRVKLQANGGAVGGNVITVQLLVEPLPGDYEDVP